MNVHVLIPTGDCRETLALMHASTGDARFKACGDLMVAELAKVQQAAPSKGYHEGFLSSLPKGSRSCDSERSSRG